MAIAPPFWRARRSECGRPSGELSGSSCQYDRACWRRIPRFSNFKALDANFKPIVGVNATQLRAPSVMVAAEIEEDPAVPVHTVALFAVAVLPLVITPGPDMLFVMSQGLSGGRSAALKADAGGLLGYALHS